MFDLETTDLSANADVLQIGALCDGRAFNVYIKPGKTIPALASAVNRLRKIGDELFYAGKKVQTETLRNELIQFQEFFLYCKPTCTVQL